MDTNQDYFETLEESLESIQRKKFGDIEEGWETVEMHPAHVEKELRHFKEELAARETELNAKVQHLSQEAKALVCSQSCLEAQKRELHQVVLQMEQRKQQSKAVTPQPPAPGSSSSFTLTTQMTLLSQLQPDAAALEKKFPEQPQLDSSVCDPLGSWHSGSYHTADGRVVKRPSQPSEDSMCGLLGEVGQDGTSHTATQASYLLPELPQSPSLWSLLSVPLHGPVFSYSIGNSRG